MFCFIFDIFGSISIDIVLPNLNGVEAYKAIRKINPEIVAVMMTGYAVEDLAKEATNEGAFGYLHKPFGIDEILSMVEKITGTGKRRE